MAIDQLTHIQNQRVCVMGLGYIGLPTASLLATKGFQVTGVDISPSVVETINEGKIHLVEPDLDILVKSAVNSGNLVANTEPVPADIFIIAVPTPFLTDSEDKTPDLSYIENAAHAIVPVLEQGNLVILESTSPVGTTDEVVSNLLAKSGFAIGEQVFVAHCPERVLPGRILIELVENDRVVGGINDRSTERAVEFYELFVKGEVLATTAKTAEMTKLTENSYRDVNIAFANELSILCEHEEINTWEVISLANRHPRVSILNPGPGVGGHCIAVDPWFIVHRAPGLARLIKTARQVNDSKPEWVLQRVRRSAERFKKPKVACLGLTFKADVNDLRESPAYDIARTLASEMPGQLMVCEPNLRGHEEFDLLPLDYVISEADIVLLLVDHKAFRSLTAEKLKEKIVIDTRGIVR